MEKETSKIQAETNEESIQLGREIAGLDLDLIGLVIGGIKSRIAEKGIALTIEGRDRKTYEDMGDEEAAFAELSNIFQVSELTEIAQALSTVQERIGHYLATKKSVYALQDKAGYTAPEPKPFSIADLLKDFLDADCDNQSCPIHHPQNRDEN